MLDKRLLWTGLGICVVSAVAVVAALAPTVGDIEDQETRYLFEPAQGITDSRTAPEESAPDFLYLIREYDGHVAVFGKDPANPELVLEKLVKHLPEYDQIQLREGIEIHSFDELNARIEDYIS